jgi:RNA polymerase sigma-70 factor, ECF subfamily
VGRLEIIPGGRAGTPGPSAPPAPAGAPASGLLEDLYRRHAAMVLARCRFLLRDGEAARDATQDVFVAALRALADYRAAASPATWLTRIATNHCLNLRRAGQAAWPAELARLSRDRRERGIEPDARELVRALLGTAPDEAREVAVLYFVDELTQAEVAEATGASLPTVRRRLRAFLSAARGALAEAFPGLTLPEPEELP